MPDADNYELTQADIAAAMNEWMRRYIADPVAFQAEFQTVESFRAEGDQPSYGDTSASYLLKLHRELNATY